VIAVTGGGPTGLVLDEARGRMYVLTRFDNAISVIRTATRQEIAYPPNPIRNLDNSLTPAQQAGRDFFFDVTVSLVGGTCASCHRIDPGANPGEGPFAGVFGTDGRSSFDGEPQMVKIPHLRNMYQKIGMFGSAATINSVGPDPFLGDQVRGFGFSHDGTVPTMFRFNSGFDRTALNPVGLPITPDSAQAKRNMEQFMLAFDTNLAPIVGQQVTLTAATRRAVSPRIDLLVARADAGECDLVAKGRIHREVQRVAPMLALLWGGSQRRCR